MKEININNFDEKLYYEKLDNGLEVFILPLSNTKSFYVSLSVKFGGINRLFKVNGKEYTVPTGIAHFLEHKLFEQEKILGDDFHKMLLGIQNLIEYLTRISKYHPRH